MRSNRPVWEAFVAQVNTRQFRVGAKWLHWLVAFFLLTVIFEAFSFKWTPPEDRATAIPAHVSVGMIILALTVLRLAYRKANPPPHIPHSTPKWMKSGANTGHFMLYALVFYMAFLGIWMAAISPVDIRIFSSFNLSAFADADKDLLVTLRSFHFAGAIAFITTLVGHVGAALWHHFVLKDDVLTRMLPFSGLVQRVLALGKPAPWRFPSANRVDWGRKASWFRDNQAG
jgi:cytochrome b561